MNKEKRAEWLKTRKTYIGGTDISSIIGVNKYKTALQVYLDKTGQLPEQEENEAMEWGNRLEEVVAQKYSEVTGRVLHKVGAIFHSKYNFLAANVDRVVGSEEDPQVWDYILECKTAGHFAGKEWGEEEFTEEIPINYYVQVAWYSAVLNLNKVDIAVLLGGQKFRIYTYNKDVEFEGNLLKAGIEFWQNHVEKRIPPEPSNDDDLKIIYPYSVPDKVILASDQVLETIAELKALKNKSKDLEAQIDEQSFIIKNYMRDNEVIIDQDGKKILTYKNDKESFSLDSKVLQEKYQEIYTSCLKRNKPIRRFLLK